MSYFTLGAHYMDAQETVLAAPIPWIKYCPWCGCILGVRSDMSPDTKQCWLYRFFCSCCEMEIQCLAKEMEK